MSNKLFEKIMRSFLFIFLFILGFAVPAFAENSYIQSSRTAHFDALITDKTDSISSSRASSHVIASAVSLPNIFTWIASASIICSILVSKFEKSSYSLKKSYLFIFSGQSPPL